MMTGDETLPFSQDGSGQPNVEEQGTGTLGWLQKESLRVLEFAQVLGLAAARAETEMGREAVQALAPLKSLDDLHAWQLALREAWSLAAQGRLTLQGAWPLAPLANRAAKGGTLAAVELARVLSTVSVAQRAREVVLDGDGPILAEDWRPVAIPLALRSRLERTVTPEGDVLDRASPRLEQIRRAIHQLEEEIDREFERLFRSSRWAPFLQEAVVTVRFGRRVVPVKREFRHSVPGIAHDQSASGQTVFVEPLPVVERQNRLAGRMTEEREEIDRILREVSREIGESAESLRTMHTVLCALDVRLAIVRYGMALGAVFPEVGGRELILRDARHPLLAHPVPISLELTESRRVLVITGPNTGGKTVALKTVGLMTALAWTGFPIACGEGTRIPLVRHTLADIGDEQNLEQNLSTFSSHMARLIPMMSAADDGTLCLVDEIGAGTDPEEGAALAEAMLERLADRRAYAVVSTHYGRLKLVAFHDARIENAQVEFDRESLRPTYHLMMGQPGSSHALYISRRLGLEEALLARAETFLNAESVKLADAILEVNRVQRQLREAETLVAKERSDLAVLREQLEDERVRFAREQDRERQRLRVNWQRQMEEIRREVEAALKEVRAEEGEARARAMETFRQRYRQMQDLPPALADARHSPAGARPEKAGDFVRVAGFSELGMVTDVNGETATVEIGSLRLKLAVSDLERVEPPKPAAARRPARGTGPLPVQKAESIRMQCDLRGMTTAEALATLDKYLDDAVLAGLPLARIIHGKGTGVLRRAVGEALRGDPRVFAFRLGQMGEGGDGVTVVQLDEAADLG
ncbi:MAG: endonuclease MutS2 [Thermaerobacter sp.]|nr:endonuclease MutS2 [Thermaerobacter sp.]